MIYMEIIYNITFYEVWKQLCCSVREVPQYLYCRHVMFSLNLFNDALRISGAGLNIFG
jgi:hypothetical protein